MLDKIQKNLTVVLGFLLVVIIGMSIGMFFVGKKQAQCKKIHCPEGTSCLKPCDINIQSIIETQFTFPEFQQNATGMNGTTYDPSQTGSVDQSLVLPAMNFNNISLPKTVFKVQLITDKNKNKYIGWPDQSLNFAFKPQQRVFSLTSNENTEFKKFLGNSVYIQNIDYNTCGLNYNRTDWMNNLEYWSRVVMLELDGTNGKVRFYNRVQDYPQGGGSNYFTYTNNHLGTLSNGEYNIYKKWRDNLPASQKAKFQNFSAEKVLQGVQGGVANAICGTTFSGGIQKNGPYGGFYQISPDTMHKLS